MRAAPTKLPLRCNLTQDEFERLPGYVRHEIARLCSSLLGAESQRDTVIGVGQPSNVQLVRWGPRDKNLNLPVGSTVEFHLSDDPRGFGDDNWQGLRIQAKIVTTDRGAMLELVGSGVNGDVFIEPRYASSFRVGVQ